ncbi:hypothetical protein DOM22_16400 [Bdellovibrio sp. ZAP7]|uniref:hypothetical protein n=1 Tax=Bdellovibrio sp. ZAP7 TaxID=2231053 RepID=UPI00115B4A31|nr:hypothetical protein [Bdellovibrio sp. ZAP7]QDK46622.1 hypothetical protein DOM22_16400 [Bdellovibrio sp. ZAP7]
MKKLIFPLIFPLTLLISSRSLAMSDIDRAILFGANAASMGTFIAQMEGEIAMIKLDYEKRFAQFESDLETNRRDLLKQTWQREIDLYRKQQVTYTDLLQKAQLRSKSYDEVVKIVEGLYKGLLKKELIVSEIAKLNEEFPVAGKDLEEILNSHQGTDIASLSSDQFEQVLLLALNIRARSSGAEQDLQNEIESLNTKIKTLENGLAELK